MRLVGYGLTILLSLTNRAAGDDTERASLESFLSLIVTFLKSHSLHSLSLSLARRSVVGGTLLNKYSWQSVRVNDIQDFKVKQGR